MAIGSYTPGSDVIVHKATVDFERRTTICKPVHLVQYDDRMPVIEIEVKKDGQPYALPEGCDVNFKVGKRNRKYAFNPALGCNADRTIVYAEITLAMVTDPGQFPAIIELSISGTKIAGSSPILLMVDKNPVQMDDIDSSSEGKSLVKFVEDAKKSAQEAAQANTEAQAANEEAQSAKDTAVESSTKIKDTEYKLDNAIDDVNDSNLRMDTIQDQFAALSLLMDNKIDGGYADADGFLYLTSDGVIVAGPIGPFAGGAGGGGGGSNNAVMTFDRTVDWIAKTVAKGSHLEITATWSSLDDEIPTGPGVLTVRVNNLVRLTKNVQQGAISVDMTELLNTGINNVKISVQDVYGNNRVLAFTITAVELSLTSTFDASSPFNSTIRYTYTPTGSGKKTVHFLVDGKETTTDTITNSGKSQVHDIPKQKHGNHTLEVYFDTILNEEPVESNHLYYDLICIEDGNKAIIFAIPYNVKDVDQYDTVVIPWRVYDPENLTVDVEIYVNDGLVSSQTAVGRTEQTYSFRANTPGDLKVKFKSGKYEREITLNVIESEIEVEAETTNLVLYLTSAGRSNNEAEHAKWSYDNINVQFNDNFNWVTDGWVHDADGNTVMRLTRGDTITIPYKLFGSDFRTSGKTIEIEFSTHDCGVYDNTIIKTGTDKAETFPNLIVKTNSSTFGSSTSRISYQYKEEEHIRLSFVVYTRTENRLMALYVNGIMSAVIQYADTDTFAQLSPQDLVITAANETIDIYNIRVYDSNLNSEQVLNNWIADTQDGALLRDRYTRNKIFDDYGNITTENLPNDVPYFIFEADELPTFKGDKKTVAGSFTNREHTSKSFTYSDATADVQGTSSQDYARKNYKVKFKTFMMGGEAKETYAIRDDSIPVNTFTFKADVASSEGANNICLAQLYNDICTYKTKPQKSNPKVRQGIDGFAMVIFQTASGDTTFIGKYNFNNDKGTEEVFGFEEGDESWEVLNNTSERVIFKPTADYTDDNALKNDFESRYPDTDEPDFTKLKAMFESCKTGLTTKEGIAQIFDKDSAVFYYLFTEMFLMVDSRAKNMFLTKYGTDNWCFLPYDFDTALGINNEGYLTFPYWLEDTDHLEGSTNVFNGQDSELWKAVKKFYDAEIKSLYQTLRSSNNFSYETVEARFDSHQATWSEAIFNEDAWFKYIEPLTTNGTTMYLPMLQGSKAEQRKWWLYNRFKYMDSKYQLGDALTNAILMRGYAKADITLSMYSPMYGAVSYGSTVESHRFTEDNMAAYTFTCGLDQLNDTEIRVYSADLVTHISDLSGLNIGTTDFSKAVKLQKLFVGNGADISTVANGIYTSEIKDRVWNDGYTNTHLETLSVGNNYQLLAIDARNCTALKNTVDMRNCGSLIGVRFDGCTALGSIDLPNGAPIEDLYFPDNATSITVQNLSKLKTTNFDTVIGHDTVTTLWIENTPTIMEKITTDLLETHLTDNARLRLVGFDINVLPDSQDSDTIETAVRGWLNVFDKYRGLDENGSDMEKAQIIGTWTMYAVTGAGLAEFKQRYPGITFKYEHVTSKLTYCNWDGTQLYVETVSDNGNGTDSFSPRPTRPSTAQYSYTFKGWTTVRDTNDVEEDALLNVGADRTVYACYTATIQKYRVRYYNGSTLLYTAENVPYGSTAPYSGPSTSTLTKTDASDPENYKFKAWKPSNTNIQQNTDCKVTWTYIGLTETLGNYSWQQIADICTAGLASKVFKEKTTDADGDIKIAIGNGNIIGETGIDMELVVADNQDYQNYIQANTIWISKHIARLRYTFAGSSEHEYGWFPLRGQDPELSAYAKALNELTEVPMRIDISPDAGMDYAVFKTEYENNNARAKCMVTEDSTNTYFIPYSTLNTYYGGGSRHACVTKDGVITSIQANDNSSIPIAFGLGDPARCHQYDEDAMKAAIADGTYKETYKLGDVVAFSTYSSDIVHIGIIASLDYNDSKNIVILLLMSVDTSVPVETGLFIGPHTVNAVYAKDIIINRKPHRIYPSIYAYVPSMEQLNIEYDFNGKTEDKPFDLFKEKSFIERYEKIYINSGSTAHLHTVNMYDETHIATLLIHSDGSFSISNVYFSGNSSETINWYGFGYHIVSNDM